MDKGTVLIVVVAALVAWWLWTRSKQDKIDAAVLYVWLGHCRNAGKVMLPTSKDVYDLLHAGVVSGVFPVDVLQDESRIRGVLVHKMVMIHRAGLQGRGAI